MAIMPRLKPPVGQIVHEETGQPHTATAAFFDDVADNLVSVDKKHTTATALVATNLATTAADLADLKANEAVVGTYLYAANGAVPP